MGIIAQRQILGLAAVTSRTAQPSRFGLVAVPPRTAQPLTGIRSAAMFPIIAQRQILNPAGDTPSSARKGRLRPLRSGGLTTVGGF